MSKYRKKPVIVEALQFTGENASAVFKFTGWLPQSSRHAHSAAPAKSLEIQVMDGAWLVAPGDWIVRIEDTLEVYKPATFAEMYEPIDAHTCDRSGTANCSLCMRWQVEMWDAINRYVVACGGDPAKHVYGNTPRMTAVADVNDAVRRAANGDMIR